MIENVDVIEVEANIYPNEVDPTVPEHVKKITLEEIKKWNTEVTANDVKFEDGTTFQEKYNSGELKGEPGIQGVQGVPGTPGKDGEPGRDGVDGKDGYTPIKGVDYFTTADKQELVDLVLAEIPSAEGVGY